MKNCDVRKGMKVTMAGLVCTVYAGPCYMAGYESYQHWSLQIPGLDCPAFFLAEAFEPFEPPKPKYYVGRLATGDEFISANSPARQRQFTDFGFSVDETARIIRVRRPTHYEVVWDST